MSPFPLGVIEGFYGQPWTWQERREFVSFLHATGGSFYFYAPKADPHFRKKWREPMPEETRRELKLLAEHCRREGVEFGVGLSPYEIYLSFDGEAKARLRERIELLNDLGAERVAILLDDMKGGDPNLASRQIEVMHQVKEWSRAPKLAFCPTYYALHPILEELFGARPAGYWEELGERLDPSIEIFWTGQKICSEEYPVGHLAEMERLFRRKPLLWDNYPVNDGPKMCKRLHLRAMTGRPVGIQRHLSGQAINPMNQPWLSRISVLTQAECYRLGSEYIPEKAFCSAVESLAGSALARRMEADLERFQDQGYDSMSELERAAFARDYRAFDHPMAREIVRWLEGESIVTRDVFLTQ